MLSTSHRRSSLEALPLPENEVHLWRASLQVALADLARIEETLAPDEHARAAGFRFAEDRRRFTAARGILREILGGYLRCEPARLVFSYTSSGKPALHSPPEAGAFRFNVSHSDELALFAVVHNREIGVDIERIRRDFAWEEIAERFFTLQEVSMLSSLPVSARHEAFLKCWTRREAYLKARGEGLSERDGRFDVLITPQEHPAVFSVERGFEEVPQWSLKQLVDELGYVVALAVEGDTGTIKYFHWLQRK